jgi:hypothetical protein
MPEFLHCFKILHPRFVRGQAEKEFKVEVEAIGRVRHKNLVRLLGYCAEGNQRYCLVYAHLLHNLLCCSINKFDECC